MQGVGSGVNHFWRFWDSVPIALVSYVVDDPLHAGDTSCSYIIQITHSPAPFIHQKLAKHRGKKVKKLKKKMLRKKKKIPFFSH